MKISTSLGDIEDSELERREETVNGQHVVEYYLAGQCVHRSIMAGLTPLEPAGGEAATFG